MLTPGMKRRGYIESDGWSDTHGFTKTDKKVWVTFPDDWTHWCKRWVWVDYLGDYFVSNYTGEHFVHLTGYGETGLVEPVDPAMENIPPYAIWDVYAKPPECELNHNNR